MPKEKKARHFTCAQCLKPPGWYEIRRNITPQTLEFRTADDLDKHLKAKHRSAMFRCPAVGCFKGASARMFQKGETLTQHIKESHKPNTLYSCPVEECSFVPSGLDELAIHAYWIHKNEPTTYSMRADLAWRDRSVGPVFNAATWLYFRCPVWNCGTSLSGDYGCVSTHLLRHFPIELDRVRDKLAGFGYEIETDARLAMENNATQQTAVYIKCPACDVRCESGVSFRRHFEDGHMLERSPGASDHYGRLRHDIKSWTISDYSNQLRRRPCWDESPFHWMLRKLKRGEDSPQCSYPRCTFQLHDQRFTHPSLLRDAEDVVADLLPHRLGLLRQYPAFISHTLFRDSLAE